MATHGRNPILFLADGDQSYPCSWRLVTTIFVLLFMVTREGDLCVVVSASRDGNLYGVVHGDS